MKLRRLRVEQLRCFRQPFELDELDAGINIVAGPNGAGKSTLVRAIRAAFLERHRSSSVDDLRPLGDASATPTTELFFELNGVDCHLQKSFLGRKRCQLRMGSDTLDGDEAEQKLAELIGCEIPQRGSSKEEHWGIPGLLWIEQGSGQEINSSVESAADHLRGALDDSLGEVASSDGDELLEKLQQQRRTYVTNTGRPSGDYAKSLELEEKLAAESDRLGAEITRYQHEVDRLATLLAAHRTDESAQPWLELRDQVKEKRASLEAIGQREQTVASERQQVVRIDQQVELLRERLREMDRQEAQREPREAARNRAIELGQAAQLAVDATAARKARAETAYQAARMAQRIARDEEQRRAVQRQVDSTRASLATAEKALASAETAQQQLAQLRELAQHQPITSADLAKLRAQAEKLREIQIRSEAVATRLRYELDAGKQLQLDDEALAGRGEKLVLESAALLLPGLGRIEIVPGGEDAAVLARQRDENEEAQQNLLHRLGFASVEAAEARFGELERLRSEIRAAEQGLQHAAPEGLSQLIQLCERQRSTLAASEAELMRLPPENNAALSLTAADEELESSANALRTIDQELNAQQLAVHRHCSDRDNEQRELDLLLAELEKPERRQQKDAAQNQLVSLQAEAAQHQRSIEEQQAVIDAAQPRLLAQDIERLEASANELHKSHSNRREQIAELQGQLKQAGAQGLEEQRAELDGRLTQTRRRCEELQRLVEALSLLIELLQEKRGELTRRMQEPLQLRLNHYLQLLFPGTTVDINEDLTLGRIRRLAASDADQGELQQQSFGTREQLGIIGRLAYADLLKEAGRPTLIMLDDALVHSDEQRLGRMKQILYDAAQRHQILLFSCHPEIWRDLGVRQRMLPAV